MINVQLEYDDVEKPNIDENWIHSVCENILMDSNQDKASITFIFSNDSKLSKFLSGFFRSERFV